MGLFGFKNDEQPANLPNYFLEKDDFNELFSLIIINSENRILFANNKLYTDFGYQSDDLLNKSIDELRVFDQNKTPDSNYWRNHLSDKLSACIQLQNKSGDLVNCRIKVTKKGTDNFWIFLDKPEEKDDPFQELQESVLLYKELVNHTPDIICFKDGDGKWLFANDSDLQLFHLTGVDYFGKTDKELAEYTHKIYRDAFLNCMATDEKCWIEAKMSRGDEIIQTPEGRKNVYDVIKIPVFNNDGSRKNLIVLGRDVTARRNAESELVDAIHRAEQSDKIKSNFLATMSHELRTPLNAVIGFANLIYEENDLIEIQEYARIINNNSKMLLNLIEDVFDVSLIESDQMHIVHSEFDLVKSIKEVYEIFPVELNQLDKLDIDFKIILDRDKFIIKGDEFRIKQILTNLIRNALKFTKKGFIHVILNISNNYWDLSVKDSGIGISKDKIHEIFEMFRQVEEGYKRSFGGAGLGLSISQRLAEMMNGEILVESELDKGSNFTLRVPIEK